jgi:hypothetical protein
MFGPSNLVGIKNSGWQLSAVYYATKIIVQKLFIEVSVGEDAERHFEGNPFSRTHDLFQQVMHSLHYGIKDSERPVIWRTQPSSQLKFKSHMKIDVPWCDRVFKVSELRGRVIRDEPDHDEVRPTQKDAFTAILKGQTNSTHHRKEWVEKVAGLGLGPTKELVDSSINVFGLLYHKTVLFHQAAGGGNDIPGVDQVDKLTKGLFSRLYPTKKQKQEFVKQNRKAADGPYEGKFEEDLKASKESMTGLPDDMFDIKPKDDTNRSLWELQQKECVKLSKMLLDDEWRKDKIRQGGGSFPLFIAANYGIWCAEYSLLIGTIHDIHLGVVQEYQLDSTGEERKEEIVHDHAKFLNFFTTMQRPTFGHQGLRKVEVKKDK